MFFGLLHQLSVLNDSIHVITTVALKHFHFNLNKVFIHMEDLTFTRTGNKHKKLKRRNSRSEVNLFFNFVPGTGTPQLSSSKNLVNQQGNL